MRNDPCPSTPGLIHFVGHRRHRHERHRRGAAQSWDYRRPGLRHQRQCPNVATPARQGRSGRHRSRRRKIIAGAEVVVVSSAIRHDKSGNPDGRRCARQGRADCTPRRNARRADAVPEMDRRHRRHPRQDHDHLDGRRRFWTPAGVDPTVINGGVIHSYGSNAQA